MSTDNYLYICQLSTLLGKQSRSLAVCAVLTATGSLCLCVHVRVCMCAPARGWWLVSRLVSFLLWVLIPCLYMFYVRPPAGLAAPPACWPSRSLARPPAAPPAHSLAGSPVYSPARRPDCRSVASLPARPPARPPIHVHTFLSNEAVIMLSLSMQATLLYKHCIGLWPL